MKKDLFRIGTCSWKYPSWEKIVYSKAQGINYLAEYALKYNTVEVDQWFYRLPDRSTVEGYVESVPESFTFAVKAPSQITLTHLRNRKKGMPLAFNPDFLSIQVFNDFFSRLEAMHGRIETIMFEFEYLNKSKMSSPEDFFHHLEKFMKNLPNGFSFSFEPRNPQFLSKEYFTLLNRKEMHHVFSEKIFMPPVTEVYSRFRDSITDRSYVRLLGGDRKKIEEQTQNQWNRIAEPKDRELKGIADMASDLINRRIRTVFYVNNHFEGSAPLTIETIEQLLQRR